MSSRNPGIRRNSATNGSGTKLYRPMVRVAGGGYIGRLDDSPSNLHTVRSAENRRANRVELRRGAGISFSPHHDDQISGWTTPVPLLHELGHPHRVFVSVHIGGTNGKGSVSTLVAEVPARGRSSGWTLHLTPSGFVPGTRSSRRSADFRGGGCHVDRTPGTDYPESGRPPSSEATTAIAFADFAARGAEIVVAEVGLGGRLDSTNILMPMVSAVTKIERDHMKVPGRHAGEDRDREGRDR